MRRTQAILVIMALLATPLALLARTAGSDAAACNGMCCLPHGHHSMARSVPQASGHEGVVCEHGARVHLIECIMKACHTGIEYGLLSPLAPTKPSALASVAASNSPRAAGVRSFAQNLSAGFLATPFQPPRS